MTVGSIELSCFVVTPWCNRQIICFGFLLSLFYGGNNIFDKKLRKHKGSRFYFFLNITYSRSHFCERGWLAWKLPSCLNTVCHSHRKKWQLERSAKVILHHFAASISIISNEISLICPLGPTKAFMPFTFSSQSVKLFTDWKIFYITLIFHSKSKLGPAWQTNERYLHDKLKESSQIIRDYLWFLFLFVITFLVLVP